jgi:hypothetical protein
MPAFTIETSSGARYMRADTMQAARVRAYKVWGAVYSIDTLDLGERQSVGGRAYDAACGTLDTMPSKAAQVADTRMLAGFYESKNAHKVRTEIDRQQLADFFA